MLASIDTGKSWDLNFITAHLVILILREKSLNGKKLDWDASINSLFPSDVDYPSFHL